MADRLEELLEALAASGEITRAAQPKGDWTWRSRGLGLPSGTAQALLDELRQSDPDCRHGRRHALYLDTSVALRATLEQGTTPALEHRIAAAPVLVTSRLALVEAARALVRVRLQEV